MCNGIPLFEHDRPLNEQTLNTLYLSALSMPDRIHKRADHKGNFCADEMSNTYSRLTAPQIRVEQKEEEEDARLDFTKWVMRLISTHNRPLF